LHDSMIGNLPYDKIMSDLRVLKNGSEEGMDVEVNAKFLVRNGVYTSMSYSEQQMSKVRKALNLKRISAKVFCEYYKIDKSMFIGMK
jgi:hypothetical protein